MSRADLPAISSWISTFVEAHAKPSFKHQAENKSLALNFDDDSNHYKVFFLDATKQSIQNIIDVLQQAQLELVE